MFAAAPDALTTLLSSGFIAGLVAAIGIWLSRRSSSEANRTQARLADFEIISGTVTALRGEVDRLEEALDQANDKAAALNRELRAAQRNVQILDAHIRQHIPQVPYPKLVRMNDVD